MAHQTADDADDGHLRVRRQAHLLLEPGLVLGLAGHVLHAELGLDARALGGIVALHVQAVEYAVHLTGVALDDALHAVSEEGVAQLLGIGGTDGGDGVAGHQRALEQVHVPVHGDGAVSEPAGGQTEEILQGLLAVTPLILNIVDGKHRLDSADLRPAHALVLQVDGHQCGLPVVAVDHLRHELEGGQQGDDGPGEEAVALPVVVVSIKGVPLEIVFVVHEVPDHAVLLQTEQAAVDPPPAQGHLDVADEFHLILPLVRYPLIERQDHLHLVARLGQSLGKAARHIGQAAGFAEGNRLRSRKQNLHWEKPPLELGKRPVPAGPPAAAACPLPTMGSILRPGGKVKISSRFTPSSGAEL